MIDPFTLFSHILYFFLPAIMANLAPVFAAYYNILPALNQPLDCGLTIRGRRLFGYHKTIRGLVTGLIAASIIGLLQGNFILGAVMGLGALWGDVMKSFFKRQLGREPGINWIPWDQIDFILGAILFSFPLFPQPLPTYLFSLLFLGTGSYITSYLGVKLNIKTSL